MAPTLSAVIEALGIGIECSIGLVSAVLAALSLVKASREARALPSSSLNSFVDNERLVI
jgi:hypothetical protein